MDRTREGEHHAAEDSLRHLREDVREPSGTLRERTDGREKMPASRPGARGEHPSLASARRKPREAHPRSLAVSKGEARAEELEVRTTFEKARNLSNSRQILYSPVDLCKGW